MTTRLTFPAISIHQCYHVMEGRSGLRFQIRHKKEADSYYDAASNAFQGIEQIVLRRLYVKDWDDLAAMTSAVFNHYHNSLGFFGRLEQKVYVNELTATKDDLLKSINTGRRSYQADLKKIPHLTLLPAHVINLIFSQLPPQALQNLSGVSQCIHLHVEGLLDNYALRRAATLKYETTSPTSAKHYIQDIYPLVSVLANAGLIREECLVRHKTGAISIRNTFKQLKQLAFKPECCFTNNSQGSALHFVVRSKAHIDQFKILLGWKIDPNHQDHEGNTILHLRKITIEQMECAIAHGADVNAVNKKGNTPLLKHSCNDTFMKFLLQKGASINYQNPQTGNTIFHLVVFDIYRSIDNQTKIVELLKKYDPQNSRELLNHKGVHAPQLLELEKRRIELLYPKSVYIPTRKELGIGRLWFQ